MQAQGEFVLKLHNIRNYEQPRDEHKVSETTCSLQLIRRLSTGFAEALVWNQGRPAH